MDPRIIFIILLILSVIVMIIVMIFRDKISDKHRGAILGWGISVTVCLFLSISSLIFTYFMGVAAMANLGPATLLV